MAGVVWGRGGMTGAAYRSENRRVAAVTIKRVAVPARPSHRRPAVEWEPPSSPTLLGRLGASTSPSASGNIHAGFAA